MGGIVKNIRTLYIIILIMFVIVLLEFDKIDYSYSTSKRIEKELHSLEKSINRIEYILQHHRHRYHDGMAIGKDGKGLADKKL